MGLESARPEGDGFSWVHLSGLSHETSVWGRSSVAVLTDAGVISSSHGLSVNSCLLDDIALATSADAFLSKVCVPHVCRSAVLHTDHGDSVLADHPGMDRTAVSVTRSYWWPGLHRD